jgi:hypothetical protein
LNGNIFLPDGMLVGYITDARGRRSIYGSGKWYELWLRKHSFVYSCASDGSNPELVGKVVETGRLFKPKRARYTATSRAGGFLLLYQSRIPEPENEEAMEARTTWKDTALISAVIYTFIYGIFYLLGMGANAVPALGEAIGFTVSMLACYFGIWALMRQFKIEAMLDGKDFDTFLMLFNRNTGVGGLNNWIILLCATSLFLSFFVHAGDFVPLQAAILIGVLVNRLYITRAPWKVCLTFDEDEQPVSPPGGGDGGEDDVPDEDDTAGEPRDYEWMLDSSITSLSGKLRLFFRPEAIAELRERNPFRQHLERGFHTCIRQLLEGCTDTKKVRKVITYIDARISEQRLGEKERMQFILDFVQRPNIEYEYDEKCEEIGNRQEYARYPDETLFDKRGDCDCKAALAAMLFKEAGHKTAYLTTSDHAAIAVAFKEPLSPELAAELSALSILTHDGYLYFFCETTGDGFKIGDLGSTMKDDIEDTYFLN